MQTATKLLATPHPGPSFHLQSSRLHSSSANNAPPRRASTAVNSINPTNEYKDAVNLNDFESIAKSHLSKQTYDYYTSGSGSQQCLTSNLQAFDRLKLVPRVLRDVSAIDLQQPLIKWEKQSGESSQTWKYPFMVAPMALQQLAHPGGEAAMAAAAKIHNIPMCLSTMSNMDMSQVASTGHEQLFFQLYVLKDRAVVQSLVEDAEMLGYKGVVVTVDAPVLARREADIRNRFVVPKQYRMAHVERIAEVRAGRQGAKVAGDTSALLTAFADLIDERLDWEFIEWLRGVTSLPIYLKGVLHPQDAIQAVKLQVDGIIISNHGGRQLDAAPAAIEALALIVKGLKTWERYSDDKPADYKMPAILVDGGIRRGTDILKCLALQADGVLIGRPLQYALAAGGQEGVEKALQIIIAELVCGAQLCGCTTLFEAKNVMLAQSGSSGELAIFDSYTGCFSK